MARGRNSNGVLRTNHTPNGQTRDPVTTIDIVQQKRFSTRPLVGSKRSYDTTHNSADLSNSYIGGSHLLTASKISRCSNSAEEDSSYRPGSTPSVTQHPLLSLRHPSYDLPPKLVDNFETLGVHAIYPWQSSCLIRSGVLAHSRNLVYTAPTGGGKSLVAEVVLLRKVIRDPQKKVILVLPYVALVQEKAKWLRRLVEGLQKDELPEVAFGNTRKLRSREILIGTFYGGSKSKASWSDADIAICTIEKANMLVNAAIEDGTITDLGVIVCDELHMLDDAHRGYILELLLTKLLTLQQSVQIIGMSATLANPEVLAKWLQAKFFVAKFRPIPIHEHLVYENSIYPSANSDEFLRTASQLAGTCPTPKPMNLTHCIKKSVHPELSNPVLNAVVALAVETAEQGYGALIFCSSRASTQATACLVAKTMQRAQLSHETSECRADILASLQALPSGFEIALAETIPYGVGFHHAGLTTEERDIVAEAYDKGMLKVMVATCSLAAGINLPARRVILNSARMGRDMVGPAMLRQMRGRAGRKGKDEVGETYLCCQKVELEPVAELLEAEMPAVASCLTSEKRGIKRAILEVLCTRITSTYQGLQEYAENSLLWQTVENHNMVLDMLDEAIRSLLSDELVEVTAFDTYIPTALGCAIVASGLTPEDGLFVHADLRQALSSFVMDSEMHLFYLFTPIPTPSSSFPMTNDISWPTFRSQLEQLDEPSLRALRLIGINPALVNKLANAGIDNLPDSNANELRTARIYRRVYSTFALRDICNEVPIHTISLRYNLPRGTVQNLAQSSHGFAAGMIKFCQRMATPYAASSRPSTSSTIVGDTALIAIDAPHTKSSSTTDLPVRSSLSPSESAGFGMLAAVLEHMQSRLYAGARADLLEMAQVTFVKGRMARVLYESGFKSVRALSEADPQKDILPIMMMVQGWKLRQIERDVNREVQQDAANDPERGNERKPDPGATYEMRRKKLEEKLLVKAQVMVRSAGFIYEREVLRTADFEE